MNAYLITYQGVVYATNADNMMEAEDKLAEFLKSDVIGECQMIPLESMDLVKGKENLIFF